MLANGRVHGDLSAYNILYWEGEITLIDFPQIANCRVDTGTHTVGSRPNPDAAFILERDVRRVCDYFMAQGVTCDSQAITAELWGHYVADDSLEKLADASLWEAEENS